MTDIVPVRKDNSKQALHCFVSGRVQGVCYRMSTRQQALSLELTGWVRNLPDGKVEIFACGYHDALTSLCQWLSIGPDLAKVRQLDCRAAEYKDLEDFSIL